MLRPMKREFLLGLACSLVAACSSLRFEDDGGDADPAPPPGPECLVDPDTVLELDGVESATLIGDALHLEGTVQGQESYAIVSLAGSNAELESMRPDLAGGATWTRVGEHHFVRVIGSRLDVLSAPSAAETSLVSSLELGAAPPAEHAGIGSADDAAFLCLPSAASGDIVLSRIELSDPSAPGLPVPIPPPSDWSQSELPCDQFGDRGLAEGRLQLLFDGSDMLLFDLPSSTITESHGFVTDGVHHYGEFTAVETDGRVVATTLENEAYAFLYYADDVPGNPQPWGSIVYSSFGGGDKRLLEVVAGRAILAIPSDGGVEIVARDIDPAPAFEEAPPPSETHVALTGGSSNLDDYRVLTHDDSRVIVSDGEQLFVVALGSDEPVAPLVLTEKGTDPSCL